MKSLHLDLCPPRLGN